MVKRAGAEIKEQNSNGKSGNVGVMKTRKFISNVLEIFSMLFLTLAIVVVPFTLVSGAPKNSSILSAVEISVFISVVLGFIGGFFAYATRFAKIEPFLSRPYIFTLVAVLFIQNTITVLSAFLLFR